MNSETQIEFFKENLNNIENLLNEIKLILDDNSLKISSINIFLFLKYLNDFCNNEKELDKILNEIANDDNKDILINIREILLNFINEEKENIINYFNTKKEIEDKKYLKLKKFEWKFIGLTTANNLDKGIIVPKIIIKLFFNDNSVKMFESDFSTIKKLQEEIEECLNGFRSTYARRIENFAK